MSYTVPDQIFSLSKKHQQNLYLIQVVCKSNVPRSLNHDLSYTFAQAHEGSTFKEQPKIAYINKKIFKTGFN